MNGVPPAASKSRPHFKDAVHNFPYAAYADSLGFHGMHVDKPEDVGPAIDEALLKSMQS